MQILSNISNRRISFMDYTKFIRDVKDYPKAGIVFKDLTTLWKEPKAFKASIDELTKVCKALKPDKIVGIESRGFIVGSAMAYLLGKGFVPVRKKGKLPAETIEETYALEYGTDTLTMHKDSISPGERVIIVDDLIATGGTCRAVANMVERLGGKVAGFGFLVELGFLKGREKLKNYDIKALIQYN
jgi:adenine phosphoribosyltransferase